jgi:hypothetical protein
VSFFFGPLFASAPVRQLKDAAAMPNGRHRAPSTNDYLARRQRAQQRILLGEPFASMWRPRAKPPVRCTHLPPCFLAVAATPIALVEGLEKARRWRPSAHGSGDFSTALGVLCFRPGLGADGVHSRLFGVGTHNRTRTLCACLDPEGLAPAPDSVATDTPPVLHGDARFAANRID